MRRGRERDRADTGKGTKKDGERVNRDRDRKRERETNLRREIWRKRGRRACATNGQCQPP